MKGYKAFNKDLRCRDVQYEIGQIYEMSGNIEPCARGFHFCKSLADCYEFYPTAKDTRICEVTALGDIKTDDEVKYCTNKIKIGREVKKPREKSNASLSSSGYCNNGNFNSGNWNSGDHNSGNWNSGDWNSGDWNSGNFNSGIFCTFKKPTIRIFDKDSDWTINKWNSSDAKKVMDQCPCMCSNFINKEKMSVEEKDNHPEYKTIGGYVKVINVTQEDKQKWWDELTDKERQYIFDLPNFNAKKFKECTGITISKEKSDDA